MTKQIINNEDDSLFEAVNNRNHSAINLILGSGVNINTKDNDGWTPLMVSVKNEDIETVNLLLKMGADTNLLNSDRESALMLSAFNGNKRIAILLISNGAKINLRDKFGRTAYDIACELFPNRNNSIYSKKKNKTIFTYEKIHSIEHIPNQSIDVKDKILPKKRTNNELNKSEVLIKERLNKKSIQEYKKNIQKIDVNLLLDFIFNKPSGSIIELSYLEKCFSNHFHQNLDKKVLIQYIKNYNISHSSDGERYGKTIKELDSGDYIIHPSLKEMESFLQDLFFSGISKSKIIKIDDIKRLYKEQFNIGIDDEWIFKFLASSPRIRKLFEKPENNYLKNNQNINVNIIDKKNDIQPITLDNTIIVRIISVGEVDGKTLRKEWASTMQVIITDKGKFIDNAPGRQFGFYSKAGPGYDWSQLIGKTVKVKIFNSKGFKWINHFI